MSATAAILQEMLATGPFPTGYNLTIKQQRLAHYKKVVAVLIQQELDTLANQLTTKELRECLRQLADPELLSLHMKQFALEAPAQDAIYTTLNRFLTNIVIAKTLSALHKNEISNNPIDNNCVYVLPKHSTSDIGVLTLSCHYYLSSHQSFTHTERFYVNPDATLVSVTRGKRDNLELTPDVFQQSLPYIKEAVLEAIQYKNPNINRVYIITPTIELVATLGQHNKIDIDELIEIMLKHSAECIAALREQSTDEQMVELQTNTLTEKI